MRIKILRVIIIGLFVLIAIDLFYVQVIRGKYYHRLSVNNRIRVVSLEGRRGLIKDRNGVILADNRHAYDVTITPQDVGDSKLLFNFLSNALNVDEDLLIKRYNKKKFAPFEPVTIAENIERQQAIIIEENKYQFSSLNIKETFKRIYPRGEKTSHVLGYVGKTDRFEADRLHEYGYSPLTLVGKSGIEEYYDAYLRGRAGGLQLEVDNRGRQVRILSFKDPASGEDIDLTIDSVVQDIAADAMAGYVGAVVLMDMDNGEILGMVSAPGFDPNEHAKNNAFSPYVNRAIQGLYPPGSVFKVLLAIGALDSKKINAYTNYFCPGYYELGNKKFGCTHNHGSQNLIEAIAHSCNVYFFHLGLLLKETGIYEYARLLGLGMRTHVDLPYEREGVIPSRRQRLLSGRGSWYAGDTLNFAIGQGDVLTTPLQLVKMMATIARGGVEVSPHLIKAIHQNPVKKFAFERKVHVGPKVFEIVQRGLRETVTAQTGTAHVLDLSDVYVAGKTGTAQSAQGRENHAWFVGYTKNGAKNIAFCVFLEHGGSSQNACLVARQLLLQMKEKNII